MEQRWHQNSDFAKNAMLKTVYEYFIHLTNVFKRLNESPYQKGNKEDCHDRKGNLDDIALCRYLRLPVKYQSEDGDHLSSDYI
jgi:hypothetical protein